MSAGRYLAAAFVEDHPEEAARVMERADASEAAALLATLQPRVAADILRSLGPSPAAACTMALHDDALAAIIDAMPLDAAGAAMRAVEPRRRDDILRRLADDRRDRMWALLQHPEHSAGALADPMVLALPDDLIVAEAQKQLRGARSHLYHYMYVVSRDRTLVGALAMAELMAARPKQTLASVMTRNPVRIEAQADLSTVAAHPAWRDFDALPVVDSTGRLIGAIRHKAIRRMSWAAGRPMMATIVGLSEVYWAGLSGFLASLAHARASAESTPTEANDAT